MTAPLDQKRLVCCVAARAFVKWREPNHWSGPSEAGFVLRVGHAEDETYERILFCPWCGARIRETET